MINRRELLGASAAAALVPPLAAWAASPAFGVLMDAFSQETLALNPEQASLLGLDTGSNAPLKSQLNDHSAAGRARARALNGSQLARLDAIDPAGLGPADRVTWETVLYARRASAAIMAFDFGGVAFSPSPYAVSQLTGAYQSTPEFLDTKHAIDDADDAQAYLARLSAFAVQLDQDTDRMAHDAASGVVPPDFLLDTTLVQMRARRQPADKAVVVTSLARRASAKGLDSRYANEAAKIYESQVLPALERQIAATEKLRPGASHEAGVGRLKEGPAFYAAALKATTTTSLSPDAIHRIGLEQAAQISARIDGLLKAQGLTEGTVGERIAHLARDPAMLFPNGEAGKAEAIAWCNGRLDAIRPRLPTRFKRLPAYRFEVRAVPAANEAGAASAFSQPPPLDGSRPGLVYFNLGDTTEWPKWALATTVYHEGLPGHQLEGGLALSNPNLPRIRKIMGFPGYAEGWGLYAEQLADEMGMYDDDPLGRIGYLKFQLFRAGRCVVDTGIHHLGWSREKAIAYFVALDGDARGFAAREVERYCTQPGQACSYKLGHNTWTGARSRAEKALGPRFDIKDFHEAGLGCGRVPLQTLDGVIDRWIVAKAADA